MEPMFDVLTAGVEPEGSTVEGKDGVAYDIPAVSTVEGMDEGTEGTACGPQAEPLKANPVVWAVETLLACSN